MKTLDDFNMKSKKPWEVEGIEWRKVKLGDKTIAKIIMGQSPPSSSYNKEGKGVPFLQGNKEFGRFHPKHVMFTIDPKKKAKKGDILLSVRAPVGDVNIADKKYCIGRGLAAIRFNGEPKYLFYLFIAIKEKLEELGKRGTTFRAITKNHLKTLKIPLPFRNGKPDLETQKKIVEYIEVNFSKIDKILEKKKKKLEKLDEFWESVLEQAFKPKEDEEWREVRLGDLVVEKPKYGLTKKAKDKGSFVLLRITDIDDQGEIKNNNFKFVDLDESEKAKYDIRKGDLLLARSGSVGNFFIAFQDYPNWIYASYLIRFRLDLNKVHLMFVKYFLSSQYFKKWVSFQKRPGVQPNINAKEYSSFKIPIPFRNNQPDLEKQKEIANYLDGVYEEIKTIKEKIQKQINLLEEMKESILDEVFNHDETK